MSDDFLSRAAVDAWRQRLGVSVELAMARVALLPNGAEESAASFLVDSELARYHGFTFPKRRREWLGGRMAAKLALCKLAVPGHQLSGEPDWRSWWVENSASGQPLAHREMESSGQAPAISISHSGDWAVAMACAGVACGIDIQQISDQTIRLRDRFCAAQERRRLAPAGDLAEATRLTLLWAAKEAVRKADPYGNPAGFSQIRLTEVAGCGPAAFRFDFGVAGATACRVAAWLDGDYALAFTVNQGAADTGEVK